MNKKLWLWFSVVVALFASATLVIMLNSEHRYKKEILSARLEGYADIVANSDDLQNTVILLPGNIRVTVLGKDGKVFFDTLESADSLDNHLARPEISQCLRTGTGYGLRFSNTAGKDYFYYAQLYGDRIVRTALPFEVHQMRFFHPSALLIWMLLTMLAGALVAAFYISLRFSKETSDKLQNQKRNMTNNIAHELRTPVTSIRGYLETLQSNPAMDEKHRKQFVERAYSQSVRLSDLIRDIALVTKIEEAPEMLKREKVDVSNVILEVLEEFSSNISEGLFKIRNNISSDLFVTGNQTLIYSIFRNLIENSIRYAGEGSIIGIESSSHNSDMIHFHYYDTGEGVPRDQLELIFERFYRIPAEESHRAEGSGLGLSIVRNAVAFHGGTVKASNLQPHGLAFDFDLPKCF
ncbi:MAG: ATP-binding protein [Bacteroidia bacterium]|nr:ATP-binding protein [Bacteroidia bacterium]